MNRVALSAIQTALSGPSEAFRIIPAGEFRSQDGRPQDVRAWQMDGAIASRMIAAALQRREDYLIDFEHASLAAKGPAPAAGWFKTLEWRPNDGLYAVGARWTGKAKAMLNAGEYRYVSPVFSYGADGSVGDLISVALTNSPALSGLTDLGALSINTRKTTQTRGAARAWQMSGLSARQEEYFEANFGADSNGLMSRSSIREAPPTERQSEYFRRCFGADPKA